MFSYRKRLPGTWGGDHLPGCFWLGSVAAAPAGYVAEWCELQCVGRRMLLLIIIYLHRCMLERHCCAFLTDEGRVYMHRECMFRMPSASQWEGTVMKLPMEFIELPMN